MRHIVHMIPSLASPSLARASASVRGCVRRSLSRTARITPRTTPSLYGAARKYSSEFKESSFPTQREKRDKRPRGSLYAVAAATAAVSLAYYLRKEDPQAEDVRRASEGLNANVQAQVREKGEDTSTKAKEQSRRNAACWNEPGVYIWGSNVGGVISSSKGQSSAKSPRRIAWFDGKILRDLKVDENICVAVLDNGDLVQWGGEFDSHTGSSSQEQLVPEPTLTGKDIANVSIARDRIIALSRSGKVYSIPITKIEQTNGPGSSESSWLMPASTSPVNFRTIIPTMHYGEKVTAIATGTCHLLLRTNYGRAFSVACSATQYPSQGQLGVPGLTFETRPTDRPFDTCHLLRNLPNIVGIAAGAEHSLLLSEDGRIYAFGDNSRGQLGQEGVAYADAPRDMRIERLYARDSVSNIRASAIAAGGLNTFFAVDVTSPDGRKSVDVHACGQGLTGTLGTGKWNHVQDTPDRIKALSGLKEYNEQAKTTLPIRIKSIVVGDGHAAAILDNCAGTNDPEEQKTFGQDLLFWGANSMGQLGTGKKNRVSSPTCIMPPISEADDKEAAAPVTESSGVRFQVMAQPIETRIGRQKVKFEQRVACGKNVTAVYCAPSP